MKLTLELTQQQLDALDAVCAHTFAGLSRSRAIRALFLRALSAERPDLLPKDVALLTCAGLKAHTKRAEAAAEATAAEATAAEATAAEATAAQKAFYKANRERAMAETQAREAASATKGVR